MRYSRLRQLARDYLEGRIDQEEYRTERRALLDALEGGEVPLERPTREPDPAEHTDNSETRPMATRRPADDAATPLAPDPAQARLQTPWIGIAVLAVVASTVGVLWLWASSPDAPAPAISTTAPRPETPLRRLATGLLERHDWSEARITAYLLEWRSESSEARDAARASAWFERLREGLAAEIDSQRALSDLGDAGASESLGRLEQMAREIGLAGPTSPLVTPSVAGSEGR